MQREQKAVVRTDGSGRTEGMDIRVPGQNVAVVTEIGGQNK